MGDVLGDSFGKTCPFGVVYCWRQGEKTCFRGFDGVWVEGSSVLVKYLLGYVSENSDGGLKHVLLKVLRVAR